ncbi:helix-turn-helix domain-containing protein [Nocardia terpenica]|uniref:DDE-type integrase/transposase/recombinase n=1 Tax=Nocardia terpenica TaxID=455432 RepID=A0A6G9ZFN3_9NOCA|nr:helix-turn-helix domain-containing protein [Nocardia terpenica]QIS23813.1 DDE-type integrase/transposase/recombinase [Nocardia terpenica]
MPGSVTVTIGTRLWMQGEVWTVHEFVDGTVVLVAGERLSRVSITHLAEHARPLETLGQQSSHPIPVVLSSLPPDALRQLELRAARLRQLSEPAATAKESAERFATTARELGVSVKTVRRWKAAYDAEGIAGLVDARLRQPNRRAVHPLWDEACLAELRSYVDKSTPTKGAVIAAVAVRIEAEHGPGVVSIPSAATAYRRLDELAKGTYAFGSAKARRSVANRPRGPFGRLRATRPGEYVVLDSTPLDVFAMEPITLRWVGVELTVAMDLFTRCVLGLRLTPISTKSVDVANVLFQCVSTHERSAEVWPFHGVPRTVLLGGEEPACMPEAIVVDHGRQYLSAHIMGVCDRLGVTVQPAIPNKPTDKPTVERFFRTLREGLLQHLPAYKGPDVYSRGKDIEDHAFLYVTELEQIIREWVGSVYHRTKHDGLCIPEIPGMALSPTEMFEVGIAKAGGLLLPSNPDLVYEFLDVKWRTIQHYGVEVNGQRYDGSALNLYRNTRSPYTGIHAGKWPIFIDVHDIRQVYFQDPASGTWHRLDWEHAPALHQPFSQDAADYVKRFCLRSNRHVNPDQAVRELLAEWSRGAIESRRDRSLARRLSAQRAALDPNDEDKTAPDTRQIASLPGVVDLLERRERRAPLEFRDDLDVFERYFAEHPGEQTLEVFDE